MKVVGYARVSTEEQGRNGYGLAAQRREIEAECARRGWSLVGIEEDVASGRSRKRRPGLERAVDACRRKEADTLVAAKLDRLSRSVVDAGRLLDEALRGGWKVVALDFGLNTATPNGRLVASVLTAVAEWEAATIAKRTREGLGEARVQGKVARLVPEAERTRVLDLAESLPQRAVVAAMERETGRRWHLSTVQRLVASERRRTAEAVA